VIGAFVVGALAGTGWRLDRTWILLGAGILTFWLADSLYLVQVANETYTARAGSTWAGGPGLVLISAAAWQPTPAADVGAAARGDPPDRHAAALRRGGLATLVYGCFERINALAIGLAALALVAIMLRLVLTFRENTRMLHTSRDEALADPLTGMPNRRALARHLDRAIPAATSDRPLVLTLFDLDGFKLYNDTFGHPPGTPC
jgi:hypothetical protein